MSYKDKTITVFIYILFIMFMLTGFWFGQKKVENNYHPTSRIEEDDPRWDCHTMGNRICGEHP